MFFVIPPCRSRGRQLTRRCQETWSSPFWKWRWTNQLCTPVWPPTGTALGSTRSRRPPESPLQVRFLRLHTRVWSSAVCVLGVLAVVWLQLFVASWPPPHVRNTHMSSLTTHSSSVSSGLEEEAPWLGPSLSSDWFLCFVLLLSPPASSSWCFFNQRLLDTAAST